MSLTLQFWCVRLPRIVAEVAVTYPGRNEEPVVVQRDARRDYLPLLRVDIDDFILAHVCAFVFSQNGAYRRRDVARR